MPSSKHSISPSISMHPLLAPSNAPYITPQPSYHPSNVPIISITPSLHPSSPQMVMLSLKSSGMPTLQPSDAPTISTAPTASTLHPLITQVSLKPPLPLLWTCQPSVACQFWHHQDYLLLLQVTLQRKGSTTLTGLMMSKAVILQLILYVTCRYFLSAFPFTDISPENQFVKLMEIALSICLKSSD